MREERDECWPLLFGQEFQLTLTGVNQTPNVHLGLGPLGSDVEIPEKKFPKIEQAELPERRKAISGIRMAQRVRRQLEVCSRSGSL
jgi:hypothetical protein